MARLNRNPMGDEGLARETDPAVNHPDPEPDQAEDREASGDARASAENLLREIGLEDTASQEADDYGPDQWDRAAAWSAIEKIRENLQATETGQAALNYLESNAIKDLFFPDQERMGAPLEKEKLNELLQHLAVAMDGYVTAPIPTPEAQREAARMWANIIMEPLNRTFEDLEVQMCARGMQDAVNAETRRIVSENAMTQFPLKTEDLVIMGGRQAPGMVADTAVKEPERILNNMGMVFDRNHASDAGLEIATWPEIARIYRNLNDGIANDLILARLKAENGNEAALMGILTDIGNTVGKAGALAQVRDIAISRQETAALEYGPFAQGLAENLTEPATGHPPDLNQLRDLFAMDPMVRSMMPRDPIGLGRTIDGAAGLAETPAALDGALYHTGIAVRADEQDKIDDFRMMAAAGERDSIRMLQALIGDSELAVRNYIRASCLDVEQQDPEAGRALHGIVNVIRQGEEMNFALGFDNGAKAETEQDRKAIWYSTVADTAQQAESNTELIHKAVTYALAGYGLDQQTMENGDETTASAWPPPVRTENLERDLTELNLLTAAYRETPPETAEEAQTRFQEYREVIDRNMVHRMVEMNHWLAENPNADPTIRDLVAIQAKLMDNLLPHIPENYEQMLERMNVTDPNIIGNLDGLHQSIIRCGYAQVATRMAAAGLSQSTDTES